MIAAENRMEGTIVLTASTQRPISCDRKARTTTHVQGEGANISSSFRKVMGGKKFPQ